jgi:hypothetical protein
MPWTEWKQKALLVIFLQNLNCFTQYPIASVMWAYHYSVRPQWVVAFFLPCSFLSGTFGGILQAKYEGNKDEM